jgi:8-oxo-dGTP diphosphatase
VRERGSIVLIEKNKVALIRRVREDSTYYVFPGGGI